MNTASISTLLVPESELPQSWLNSVLSDPKTKAPFLKLVDSFTDVEAEAFSYMWDLRARPDQMAPAGDWWNTWLIVAGRGAGKTRSGAEFVRQRVEGKTPLGKGLWQYVALIAADAADARDVMVEGESGILACSPPDFRPYYEPSKRRLTWPNGARATLYSAEDPEALRGPQSDGGWCDEIAKWKYAQATWDNFMFGLRLGRLPQVCATTTPRNTLLFKELIKDPTTTITRATTYANRQFLAPAFFDRILKKYEGTRLGRQEIMAELLEDNPDALWNRKLVDEFRQTALQERAILEKIVTKVVAIDPAVTSGEKSDETGIVVAGRDRDYNGYLFADKSVQGYKPSEWAREAVALYYEHDCDYIVVEVNNGGEMIKETIEAIDANVKVVMVHASKGKAIRAQPIATKAEKGEIMHCGAYPQLEDELCSFTIDYDRKTMGSPNRLDAYVWAFTELLLKGEAQEELLVA